MLMKSGVSPIDFPDIWLLTDILTSLSQQKISICKQNKKKICMYNNLIFTSKRTISTMPIMKIHNERYILEHKFVHIQVI